MSVVGAHSNKRFVPLFHLDHAAKLGRYFTTESDGPQSNIGALAAATYHNGRSIVFWRAGTQS
jgi:hypothetical protein